MYDGMGRESGARGRFGYVSDYDPKRHMARVTFPDKGGLVSAWLPVAVPNSKRNHDERHLDIGEHVYCNMLGNGLEAGVVICAIYDDKNPTQADPGADRDIRRVVFDDRTVIEVDRARHVVEVKDSYGSYIRFADGNIYIKSADKVFIN